MAVLKIAHRLPVTPVKIGKKAPEIGETVWVISNPSGKIGFINKGIYGRTDKNQVIVSVAGTPGSSGGMILNNKGEQVGVLVTGYTTHLRRFVPLATVFNGVTRTKDMNKFLKGIL